MCGSRWPPESFNKKSIIVHIYTVEVFTGHTGENKHQKCSEVEGWVKVGTLRYHARNFTELFDANMYFSACEALHTRGK